MFRFVAISVAALLATATLAQAQPDRVRQDIQVRYDDLNLANERDASVMLGRIERAAERVCSHSPYLRTPDRPTLGYLLKDAHTCREQAVAEAVASLRAPLVTRLYARSQGRHPNWFAGW